MEESQKQLDEQRRIQTRTPALIPFVLTLAKSHYNNRELGVGARCGLDCRRAQRTCFVHDN